MQINDLQNLPLRSPLKNPLYTASIYGAQMTDLVKTYARHDPLPPTYKRLKEAGAKHFGKTKEEAGVKNLLPRKGRGPQPSFRERSRARHMVNAGLGWDAPAHGRGQRSVGCSRYDVAPAAMETSYGERSACRYPWPASSSAAASVGKPLLATKRYPRLRRSLCRLVSALTAASRDGKARCRKAPSLLRRPPFAVLSTQSPSRSCCRTAS